MSERHEHTVEKFGKATGGFSSPVKFVDIDKVGVNTPLAVRKLRKLNENVYNAQLTWLVRRQVSFKQNNTIQFCSSAENGSTPVFDAVTAPTFTDVVPKLLDKWRSSEFNLGVFVAEGRESAEMIADRMVSIVKAANAIRRRNLGDALRHLAHVPKHSRSQSASWLAAGALSNAWLELHLGWQPLIQDISSLAAAIKAQPIKNRIRAHSTKSGGCKPLLSSVPQSRIQLFRNDRRLQFIVVVTHAPTLQERLGLTDALTIAWEAAPLSFVIDYFSPVGDYLKSIHAVNVMPVTDVISTSSTLQSANCQVLVGDTVAGYPVVSGGVTSKTSVGIARTIQHSLPVAWAINAQTPREISVYEDASLARIGTMAALVQQSLRRLIR